MEYEDQTTKERMEVKKTVSMRASWDPRGRLLWGSSDRLTDERLREE